jgi:hypothetical protein
MVTGEAAAPASIPGLGHTRKGAKPDSRSAGDVDLAADGVAAATRTLPRDVASFTGRHRELGELVDAAAGKGGVVGIHAIGGMAGIGKTAFAVHAAHRLAGRRGGRSENAGQVSPQLTGAASAVHRPH